MIISLFVLLKELPPKKPIKEALMSVLKIRISTEGLQFMHITTV